MPITYSFDQERGLVLTKVSGALTIAITTDYFGRLQQDKDCPDKPIEIVDFTDVTDFALEYGEMKAITKSYQGAKSTWDIWATIFNCPSELSYGIARMLRTLHDITNSGHRVLITRSHEELNICIENLQVKRQYIYNEE
jgi:hypothetical protein